MGVKELRRERAVRRIWEGAATSVLGGLILWSLTTSMSRAVSKTEPAAVAASPTTQSRITPTFPPLAPTPTNDDSMPPVATNLSPVASIPLSMAAIAPPVAVIAPPKANPPPYSIPVGSVLLYENFSHYREGEPTDWGPDTFIKTGLDRRHWLVSNIDGTHPVGRRIRLPKEFCFECRYSAYMPEVTRGVLGWWKEPVSTKISFLNDQGVKYAIQWVIGCGNDITRLNPLGSSSLYAKKHLHTVRLPDGTAKEIDATQPTGILRIDRDNQIIKVSIDNQVVVVGTTQQMNQLVGFEIEVVKAKNATLFFTDFKIAR